MKVTISCKHKRDLIEIEDVDVIERKTNFVYIRTKEESYSYPWRVVLSVRVEGLND